jgi:opacity protein-like surface antigen
VHRKDSIVTRQLRRAPLLSVLLGLVLAAGSAAAGEGHGTDFFAGYSFAQIQDSDRHGANLALGFDLVGPLSGFVDTSFHWGSQEGVSLSDLTLMAGPGLRFGKRGGTVFFVRALAGLVQDKASIGVLDVDISETDSRLGVMGGGGVDFRVASKLAVRLQGDYFWNDVDEGKSSGFRASAGIVYRFGSAQ